MKEKMHAIIPQRVVNNFWHLPKAIIANIKYGFPSRKITVIGVTGTDGKTTTVNMIYKILKDAGKKVSVVSTINAVIGNQSFDTGFHVTSPNPFMVQQFIKQASYAGDEYIVLEVTSHALDQYRFWGIKFKVGVITNITHEHLDYHKNYQKYYQTKLKLILNSQFSILNSNLEGIMGITFGLHSGDFNQNKLQLKLSFPGSYNIENALAAIAVASLLGIDLNVAKRSLQNFTNLSGRMEEVKNNKGIKIYVDFAHTPNALENVLKTLKKETKGRLVAVFGSAGKRDVDKRSMIGEIGQKLADIVIITSEDPRGELEKINQQITSGAKKSGAKIGENFFVINDRYEAIHFTVNNLAKKGDTIGIFGKGHEQSMNFDGKNEMPWSDIKAVETALKDGSKNKVNR